MKQNTSELMGLALDWAVAKACGYRLTSDGISTLVEINGRLQILGPCTTGQGIPCGYSPSTDWGQGGPLIDRETIWLRGPGDATKPDGTVVMNVDYWYAHKQHRFVQNGPTALVAAMRCWVAIKLGDVVDVPQEILDKVSEEA